MKTEAQKIQNRDYMRIYAKDPNHKKQKYLYNRKYDAENREKVREYKRKYASTDKGKHTKYIGVLRRRAVKRAAITSKDTNSYIEAFIEGSHTCAYCGKEMERKSIDHIIPLVKGGSHTPSNLVVCCLPCNVSKSSKEYW